MTDPTPAALDAPSPLVTHAPDHPVIHDAPDAQTRRKTVRRTQIAAVVVVLLLAAGAGRTVFSRMANARVLESSSAEQSKQYVHVTQAKRSQTGQTLVLPGTLQGFVQSPIAARSSGYLKRWTKDIGSRVEKGELLADIESPEIDQQLSQAVAAREQAASSLALARSTVERWEGLRKKDVVSQQDLDEKRSAVAQMQASVAAADANMQRLRQLEAFKHVVAPFSGVITRRNVDVGDLIDSAKVLFTLSQTDPLRVYVNVPQASAQLVKPGQKVTVTQAELRGQKFEGQVSRTSASIDTLTRTMQVEVALPNRDHSLLPGAYVQIALPLAASQALTVPTNTLLFRGTGTMVGVVDAKGGVTLRRIGVGRNYGENFEVLDGVTEADRIVLNPPDWLADGQTVTVAENKPVAPATAASAGATGTADAAAAKAKL
ncbi:MAG: efflux transporter periplasmic adaptor subunit [Rhodoferax sp.]|nr:efflux transporter periplasmic adaptor subunit [Rhodoferax sp.]